jgi:O-antigen ligase
MALEAFREHPFTGLGAGNFVHPLQYFQLAARVGAPPGFFGPDDSHSLYLGVLADLGLLGAVPLAVIVVLTVTRICRLVLHDSPDRRVTSVTHALAITTAGYLVAAAFIPVQDFQLPYILIGLVQGLAVAQSRVGRTLPESNLPGHVGRLSHS